MKRISGAAHQPHRKRADENEYPPICKLEVKSMLVLKIRRDNRCALDLIQNPACTYDIDSGRGHLRQRFSIHE